jgi:hypothetical protein
MRKDPHPRPLPEPPDPVAEYREWIEHRYTPGYYGSYGKTPPSVRNFWSKRDRKWLGTLYIAVPLIGFILAFRRGVQFDDYLLGFALWAGVYFAIGLILLLARDKPKEPKHGDRRGLPIRNRRG